MMFRNLFAIALSLAASTASAQQADLAPAEAEPFAPENAILDTSVMFVAGAREAEQDLRAAFGWPTFQEGSVGDVYFRFDPDGYARFSPSPRLDTDVFEVVCTPATRDCAARKPGLTLGLGADGRATLAIEGFAAGDRIFLDDGLGQIEVPSRAIGYLEPVIESVLSQGKEIIVRRGENDVFRAPIVGFGATLTYLRWVASGQNPRSLPSDWPLPQAADRQVEPPSQDVVAVSDPAVASDETATLRQERLGTWRPLAPAVDLPRAQTTLGQGSDTGRIEMLEAEVLALKDQIAAQMHNEQVGTIALPRAEAPSAVATPAWTHEENTARPEDQTAEHLAYLVREIGLDPRTAVMILELSPAGLSGQGRPQQDEAKETLTNILLSETTDAQPSTQATRPVALSELPTDEYLLLSEYFRAYLEAEGMDLAPPAIASPSEQSERTD